MATSFTTDIMSTFRFFSSDLKSKVSLEGKFFFSHRSTCGKMVSCHENCVFLPDCRDRVTIVAMMPSPLLLQQTIGYHVSAAPSNSNLSYR